MALERSPEGREAGALSSLHTETLKAAPSALLQRRLYYSVGLCRVIIPSMASGPTEENGFVGVSSGRCHEGPEWGFQTTHIHPPPALDQTSEVKGSQG